MTTNNYFQRLKWQKIVSWRLFIILYLSETKITPSNWIKVTIYSRFYSLFRFLEWWQCKQRKLVLGLGGREVGPTGKGKWHQQAELPHWLLVVADLKLLSICPLSRHLYPSFSFSPFHPSYFTTELNPLFFCC